MPVGTRMSAAFVTGADGSDATDLGGSFSIVSQKAPAARTQATPSIFRVRIVTSGSVGVVVAGRNAGLNLDLKRPDGLCWIRGHRFGRVLEHGEAERSCRQSESNSKQLQLAHVALLEEPDQPPQAASSSEHTDAR